jgi:hypothetical protein
MTKMTKTKQLNPRPPPIQGSGTLNCTLRFNMPNVLKGWTNSDLLDLLAYNEGSTSSPSTYRLATDFRVHSVEMWIQPSINGTVVTGSIEFSANQLLGGRNLIKTDSTLGTAQAGYIKLKPKPGTSAYMWQSALTAEPFMSMSCSGNAIVDINITFALADYTSAAAGTATASAATTATNAHSLVIKCPTNITLSSYSWASAN